MKLPGFLKRSDGEEDDEDEDVEGESQTRVIDDSDDPGGHLTSLPEHRADDHSLAGDDIEDIDFGDDEDDGDEDADGGPPVLFLVIGALVLIGGVIGGAMLWFMGGESAVPAVASHGEASANRVEIMLPANPAKKPTNDNPTSQSVPEKPVSPAEPPPVSAAAALGTGGLNARAGSVSGPHQGLVIPSVASVSYRSIPDQVKSVPLANAPDKNLVEQVNGLPGKLPIIGKDGRKPWEVYARPATASGDSPRIAIVVKGLGFSRAATIAAIKKLPGDVSLAFSPYAEDLNDWLVRARLAGHEVFLELPMESKDFPNEDAGPLAMTTNLQVSDNVRRLQEIMSHMEGYVGLISDLGSKFMDAEGQLKPVLEEINRRGLMFVDGTGGRTAAPKIAAEIGLAKAFVNITLDDPPERQSMDGKFKSLEQILRQQPVAVAVVHAYPSTLRRLVIWLKTLEQRKMLLVPLSAVANKQFVQ